MKTFKDIIFLVLVFSNILILPLYAQQEINQNHSKQLIERYNKIRVAMSLPKIKQDSIMDMLLNEILLNDKMYKKTDNSFNKDSVRHLLFNNGIIDYKFDIKEFSDKDTNVVFNTFLLADKNSNAQVGYSRLGNRNMLIKTTSYLSFDHGEGFVPRVQMEIDRKNIMKKNKIDIKTDSLKYYITILTQGKYYYHYSDHIPLESESIETKKRYNATIVQKNNKGWQNKQYDLIFTSINPNMYLIVSNEKKEKILILK